MPDLALAIGNKNYSSWSMRPWVLLRQAGIPFREIQLWFDEEGRARGVEPYSLNGQVPVLLVDDARVWDSLAICETVAELFPGKQLWPADARACARPGCLRGNARGIPQPARGDAHEHPRRASGQGNEPGGRA